MTTNIREKLPWTDYRELYRKIEERGEARGEAKIIRKMLEKNMTVAEIADLTDLSEDEVREHLGSMETAAPSPLSPLLWE